MKPKYTDYTDSNGNNADSREKIIIRTSIIGIITNILLAATKAVIGLMSSSIAIVMDAVNNISDAGASLITIIGTKLAGRQPDKKHPFGYGRVEYLSAMIISLIVLYAGITSLTESVKKIINPDIPEYQTASLAIIVIAVLVKIILGRYVTTTGKKVNSSSLINSGEEATLDSIISASTLLAAVLFLAFGISLEAWLGAVISVIIIKSGLEMLKDTVSQILGEGNDAELAKHIKETVTGYPDVLGAYDLVLNNYGPDSINGSIHVEVPDTFSMDRLDRLTREIQEEVYLKHKVILTAIGIYSSNTKDEHIAEIQKRVRDIALSHQYVRQIHGFYFDSEKKTIRFDAVISFDAKDRREVCRSVYEDIKKEFPDHDIKIAMDTDFSEK
ncbi:MAG: cation diffusion facilitator family transporter [Lachnospiraceae bacterium]|nr:cation diffusion facilitator family transporter [Lachnospiraceae bacterium]